MKKLLFFTLFLISNQHVNAQYTEIINSKRPGFSESPYGVGTDVLQVEGGFFFGKNNSDETLVKTDSRGATIFIRYGKFIEKLEVNTKITYQHNELTSTNFSTPIGKTSGISELTIGAKYLFYHQKFTDKSKEIRSWKKRTAFDKKRLIPSVGLYLGVNTNFLGKDYIESGISPKAAILLQNDFTNRFILVTNLIADKIGKETHTYSYIVTATYSINQGWSFFVENEGYFLKTKKDFQLGTGVAYLWSENLQLDVSARTNLNNNQSNFITSIGVSWRLDSHRYKKIEVDKYGKKIKYKKRKKKGNFFSRLFKNNKK